MKSMSELSEFEAIRRQSLVLIKECRKLQLSGQAPRNKELLFQYVLNKLMRSVVLILVTEYYIELIQSWQLARELAVL